MKILLIRHGETTGDLEDRYGGTYDDHLTEEGRQQLARTAQLLKGKEIKKIYSSTLIRARESTEIISEVLSVDVEFEAGLQERDYGVLGGLTKEEAIEKYPEAVELHKDPANTDPEGESQFDFIQRVTDTFTGIVERGGEQIVILSHGGPIKVVLKHLNMPLPDRIEDGQIIEVDLNSGS